MQPAMAWISMQRSSCDGSCWHGMQVDYLHAGTLVLELEQQRELRSREWRDDERASEG